MAADKYYTYCSACKNIFNRYPELLGRLCTTSPGPDVLTQNINVAFGINLSTDKVYALFKNCAPASEFLPKLQDTICARYAFEQVRKHK